MAGTKRFHRHGLVISTLGHAALLALGLIFLWANPPREPIPPDAMLVEMVRPEDIPRYSGTPSELRNSGTDKAAQSQPGNSDRQQPPTPPAPEQKDQRQAQRKAPPPPKPAEPKDAPPEAKAPTLMEANAAEVAKPQPSPEAPPPSEQETPEDNSAVQQMAQMAMLGGPLGGGFAAPPVDSPLVGYDFTVPFRERISSCASLPAGINPTDPIKISLRVFLNRDGTLAAEPKLLDPRPSAEQLAMMQSFVAGLHKCQPYTMLPVDKYKQWKMLDLVVYPLSSFRG